MLPSRRAFQTLGTPKASIGAGQPSARKGLARHVAPSVGRTGGGGRCGRRTGGRHKGRGRRGRTGRRQRRSMRGRTGRFQGALNLGTVWLGDALAETQPARVGTGGPHASVPLAKGHAKVLHGRGAQPGTIVLDHMNGKGGRVIVGAKLRLCRRLWYGRSRRRYRSRCNYGRRRSGGVRIGWDENATRSAPNVPGSPNFFARIRHQHQAHNSHCQGRHHNARARPNKSVDTTSRNLEIFFGSGVSRAGSLVFFASPRDACVPRLLFLLQVARSRNINREWSPLVPEKARERDTQWLLR